MEYTDSTWVKYMWWVYIIGLIWISEFITACQTMVISGAVAHWYFRYVFFRYNYSEKIYWTKKLLKLAFVGVKMLVHLQFVHPWVH